MRTWLTRRKHRTPDFIRNQIGPFTPTPVFLGIGNHETIQRTRGDFVAQFADWLNRPEIQQQRLTDDPNDHMVRPYYHWIQGGVDFISMDNSTTDTFDNAQMAWLRRVLDSDARDGRVKAIVVGMHAALPHSLGCQNSDPGPRTSEPCARADAPCGPVRR